MRKFNIYNINRLIGWTNLPNIDLGMGIADGKFVPTGDYESARVERGYFGRDGSREGLLRFSMKTSMVNHWRRLIIIKQFAEHFIYGEYSRVNKSTLPELVCIDYMSTMKFTTDITC